jgi:DNA-binding transcriptional LysR family regulator
MKLNGVDLNKLYVLCAVVQHRGYKGASEDLGLSRSAISQSLTGLESQLGYALFHRVGTQLVLTEPARQFHDNVARALLEINQSVSEFTNPYTESSGTLRIGSYLEFTKSKMMPVLQKFMETEPRVQMKFSFHSPSRLLAALEKQKLDLCISIFPYEGRKSSITNRKLYQEELVLIARKDQWAENPEREKIMLAPVIDYYPNHVLFRRWWKCHYQQNLAKVNLRCYAATADMVIEFVKRGLGVGVVPKYVFEHGNRDQSLHIIKPSSRRLMDYVWLIYFKQPRSSHLQNKLLKLLENMD